MQTLSINAGLVRTAVRSPRTFVLTTLVSFVVGTAGLLAASWYANTRGAIDATVIEEFGGDPDGFYDPYHPATRNCDRVIERIAQTLYRP